MKKDLNALKGLDTKTLVVMLHEDMQEVKDALRDEYVSKEQFLPVKRCCYGIVGAIFMIVTTAIISALIK